MNFSDYSEAVALRNNLHIGEIEVTRRRPGEGNFSVLARSRDRA